MKAEQLVYGRVTRGLNGASAGYQVAAQSPGLKENRTVLERLIQLSHYPEPPLRVTPPVRFGFAGASEEWFTFWRCCFVKDLSGRAGYFAHHLVIHREEMVRAGNIPLWLLRQHPFFEGESSLPEHRDLGPIEWVPPLPASALFKEDQWAAALGAVSASVISKCNLTPVWLTDDWSDAEILLLLEQALGTMPPDLVLKTFFCVNYAFTLDNVVFFRLLTCPRENLLPDRRDSLQLLASGSSRPPLNPYFQRMAEDEANAGAAQRLMTVVSGWGEAGNADRLKAIKEASEGPQPVLSLVEQTWPQSFEGWLRHHPDLYLAYYSRTPEWTPNQASPFFGEAPQAWREAWLTYLDRPGIKAWLLQRCLQEILKGNSGLDWIGWLDRQKLIPELVVLAQQQELPLRQGMNLADCLCTAATYSNEYHRQLADQLLLRAAQQLLEAPIVEWISRQVQRCGMAAEWLLALDHLGRGEESGRLPSPDRTTAETYGAFTRALAARWFANPNGPAVPSTRIQPWICASFPEAAMAWILQGLRSTSGAEMIQAAEASGFLNEQRRDALIAEVEQWDRPGDLVPAWLHYHESIHPVLTPPQEERLRRMQQQNQGLLGRLLGKWW